MIPLFSQLQDFGENSYSEDSTKDKETIHSENEQLTVVQDSLLLDDVVAKIDSIEIDSLLYSADSSAYFLLSEQVDLLGDAFLEYQTTQLKSDTISINLDKGQAESFGNAWMQDKGTLVIGDGLKYDFDSQTGYVISGATKFDTGYCYGNELRKVSKNVYDIDEGIFTNCDAKNPHFHMQAKYMRIYKGDKIVAKPMLFYVNHFPILIAPFGTFSIKRGRKTGFLVPEPGYNNVDGKYLKNLSYFFAIKDYADVLLEYDYYELTGWETRFDFDYLKRYMFNGKLFTSLRKKENPDIEKATYYWQLKEKHHHEIGYRKTLDANINFVNSKEIWENEVDPEKRLTESMDSSVAFKTQLWGRSFYLSGSYRNNMVTDKKNITLPSFKYSLPSKPLYEFFVKDDEDKEGEKNTEIIDKKQEEDVEKWYENFYVSYNISGSQVGYTTNPDADLKAILYKVERDSIGNYITQHNAGIKHSASLSYNYKLKGWLNLTQSCSYNEAWFDRDKNEKKFVRANDYHFSTSSSFNLYGVKTYKKGYLSAIRHTMTPNVSYTYTPDFHENSKYYRFGNVGIGSGNKSKRMTFSIANKWDLKIAGVDKKDGRKEKTINGFFSMTSGTSYDFEAEDTGFKNISHRFTITPAKAKIAGIDFSLRSNGSANQDIFNFEIIDWRVSNSISFSGNLNFIEYFPQEPNKFESNKFFKSKKKSEKKEILHEKDSNEEEVEKTDIEKEKNAKESDVQDSIIKEIQDKWSLSISHSYSKNLISKSESHSLHNSLSCRITQKWSLSYSNYYDVITHELRSHSLSINRDLHCWYLSFKFNKSTDFWDYRFVLANVKLPQDLKFRTSGRKH